MKQIDLLEEIQKEKLNLKTNQSDDRLNDLLIYFFQIATPLDMFTFINTEDGKLSAKSLTYAIVELFKNKNIKTMDVFFKALEENKFTNKKDINWYLIFNTLDKNIFSNYMINATSTKNTPQIEYLEKFWDIKNLFKEESLDYYGKKNSSIDNHSTHEEFMNQKYSGEYYEHIQNNPEKLNYLLTKDIPYSQIKNMFFEAVRIEDTRTIGRLLHSKYTFEIVKDSDVHNFFILEMPENDALKDLKHEVLLLIQQLEERYKEMLGNVKDENFKKHKKI